MKQTLEVLKVTPEEGVKYLIIVRGVTQVSHMVNALQGVFPDNTPILLLSDKQRVEVYPKKEGDVIHARPPLPYEIYEFFDNELEEG